MNKVILSLGVAVVVFQLCFIPTVSAKLHTWVDRNGVTRRTYYPPPADQVRKGNVKKTPVAPQKKIDNKVELYVTSWCPYCKQAIAFFKSKGIKVKIYDIEKNQKAAIRKKKMDKSGRGVPFAVINGKYISGYAPKQYSGALK